MPKSWLNINGVDFDTPDGFLIVAAVALVLGAAGCYFLSLALDRVRGSLSQFITSIEAGISAVDGLVAAPAKCFASLVPNVLVHCCLFAVVYAVFYA